ncbi:3'(2'),5'-bisphosphate nucleotidase 1 [Homalodisca vitripennis]|nr:3'(2'),5'-bisphosphate nucleotidase 1 [Homalodisca vitripennis]
MLLMEGKAHTWAFASGGTKRWDTCAPEAVLHAAGGKLTDLHGNSYSYAKDTSHANSGGVLATAHSDEHDIYLKSIPSEVDRIMSLLVCPFLTYCCSVFELFGTLDFYFGYVNATSIFIHDIGGIGSENRRPIQLTFTDDDEILDELDDCDSIFGEISIQNEKQIIKEDRDSDCDFAGNLDDESDVFRLETLGNDGEEFDQFVDNVIEVGQGDANNRVRPMLQTSRLRGRAMLPKVGLGLD